MPNPNPYSPTSTESAIRSVEPRRRVRRFFLGAAVGASLPALLGGYGLMQFHAYMASLPPGTGGCGNGALGPIFLILFVSPLLGLIGGGVAQLLR